MGPSRIGSVVAGEVGARHAGSQLERGLTFHRLALADQSARRSHDLALKRFEMQGKSLGLSEDRLAFESSMFRKAAKDRDTALGYTIASGLLTAGMSTLEGMSRARDIKAATLDQKRRNREIDQYLEAGRLGIPQDYLYGSGGK
jgi:hypothetical protein